MAAVNRRSACRPTSAQLPIPVPFLGTVNLWLLEGDPLTLVDTGPRATRRSAALERQLAAARARRRGHRARCCSRTTTSTTPASPAAIKERSGARVAALGGDGRVGRRLPRAGRRRAPLHGAAARRARRPRAARRRQPSRSGSTSSASSADYETDVVLADGDEIAAGGRTLRVVAPSGSQHDRHALRRRRSERGVRRRPPARGDHLRRRGRRSRTCPAAGAAGRCSTTSTGLRLTAAMELGRLLPGPRAR